MNQKLIDLRFDFALMKIVENSCFTVVPELRPVVDAEEITGNAVAESDLGGHKNIIGSHKSQTFSVHFTNNNKHVCLI